MNFTGFYTVCIFCHVFFLVHGPKYIFFPSLLKKIPQQKAKTIMEEEEETAANLTTTDGAAVGPMPPDAADLSPPIPSDGVQVVGEIQITGAGCSLVSDNDNEGTLVSSRPPTPPAAVSDCDDEADGGSDRYSVGSHKDASTPSPEPPELGAAAPVTLLVRRSGAQNEQPLLGGGGGRPQRHVHIRESIEIHEASDSSRQDKRERDGKRERKRQKERESKIERKRKKETERKRKQD